MREGAEAGVQSWTPASDSPHPGTAAWQGWGHLLPTEQISHPPQGAQKAASAPQPTLAGLWGLPSLRAALDCGTSFQHIDLWSYLVSGQGTLGVASRVPSTVLYFRMERGTSLDML